MKRWMKYVRPYKKYFIMGPLCMIIEVVGEMFMPIFLAEIINRANNGTLTVGSSIGIAAMIVVQTVENIGMCLCMLPVVGITLPFMSCGGSSTLAIYITLGMVHSIYNHRVRFYYERDRR